MMNGCQNILLHEAPNCESMLKDDGISFEEPWQAQAFSITVLLNQAGLFDWKDWVKTFAKHISNSPRVQGETDQQAYYRQWLAALEDLLDSIGLTDEQKRVLCKENWRRSYVATDHGQAIEYKDNLPYLANPEPHHHHHHHHVKPEPITVSLAK